jgi:hypothetical protein
MTKVDCELVEEIIKHTTTFKVHNIAYELNGKGVTVWSTLYNSDSFYATEIIPLFTELFQTSVTYDGERDKCVLVIF